MNFTPVLFHLPGKICFKPLFYSNLFCVVSLFISNSIYCQTKFESSELRDPKQYGEVISSKLNTKFIDQYPDSNTKCIYLKNGFKTSKFVNSADWSAIKDKVEPYKIDIVYSKFPLTNGVYSEFHPLLLARIESLFELDPLLNDPAIEWNKVLQTNCVDSKQVKELFHGIVIWYTENTDSDNTDNKDLETELNLEKERIKPAKEGVESVKIVKQTEFDVKTDDPDQMLVEEISESIRNIKSFSFIPDSLIKVLSAQPLDQQINTIRNFIAKDLENDPETTLKNASKEEIYMYLREIEDFMMKFPALDSVVIKVLDRHPEWKNAIVINDWTGSMYGYGAQVLLWHVTNFETSGITSITLFNDGDSLANTQKKIGNTGGIYTEHPDNVLKLQKTFNYVMLQGMGGDKPENDIEAILEAIKTTPNHSEIILIADNSACIRDLQLIDLLDEPVKVIICGYDPKMGINADLIYLAKKTNGGIYTLTEDIENLRVDYDKLGNQLSMLDDRFTILDLNCGNLENRGTTSASSLLITDSDRYDIVLEHETNSNLKYVRANKDIIKQVIARDTNLAEIPKFIYKIEQLEYINFSNSKISILSPKIQNLSKLRTVNLSFNTISEIPKEFGSILFIENLDLSHNKLKELPSTLVGFNFLKKLNLSYNQISEFNDSIKLKKLERLNLSHNKLKELPAEIGALKKLKSLNLSNNSIQKLPNTITNLTNLQELNLKNNKLTVLPPVLFKWKKLKILNLENNNFSEEEKTRIKSILTDTVIYF